MANCSECKLYRQCGFRPGIFDSTGAFDKCQLLSEGTGHVVAETLTQSKLPADTILAYFSRAPLSFRLDRYGMAWFDAADVCAILGFESIDKAVATLGEDDVDDQDLFDFGDSTDPICCSAMISESGLYQLIQRSSKLEAGLCKKWLIEKPLLQLHAKLAEATVDLRSTAPQAEFSAQRMPLGELTDFIGELGQAFRTCLEMVKATTGLDGTAAVSAADSTLQALTGIGLLKTCGIDPVEYVSGALPLQSPRTVPAKRNRHVLHHVIGSLAKLVRVR